VPALVTIAAHQKVGEAIDVMQRYSISQLPVVRDGSVAVARRRDRLAAGPRPARPRLQEPDALHEDVAAAMQPPLAAVDASQTLDEVFANAHRPHERGRRRRRREAVGVLTRSDCSSSSQHQRQTSS
jgi:cystathionine beta-synthase